MLEDRDFFLIEPGDEPLDCHLAFGNANPLYLEIGCGKGEFISQYPKQHLNWNFLGFEMREKRIRNILKKLDPKANPNVRIIRRMIDDKITGLLPENSVEGVFIQHPDPWPKKRHYKRRLIQQAFLNALALIVVPGGQVHIATDHEEYANWIAEEFLKNHNYLTLNDGVIQTNPSLEDHVVTWYESEQRRQGYEPNFMLFKRI
jgi:tRNA (guanine-N7-)-methyltransferase